jgi:ribosomal protein L37AE/L43A
MSIQVDLACTVCAEEFLVPIRVYRAHSGILSCPCCGSTELVLLGERETSDDGRRG